MGTLYDDLYFSFLQNNINKPQLAQVNEKMKLTSARLVTHFSVSQPECFKTRAAQFPI